MRIWYISVSLRNGMATYPGDVPFVRTETRSLEEGADLNLSSIAMSAHAGTHVDAPYHFLSDGNSVDELPADAFCGPATVLDLTYVHTSIEDDELGPLDIPQGEIVLLKTRNSSFWSEGSFVESYVYLGESGARLIIDRGAKAVGIDYLSVEGFGSTGYPSHRLLLSANIGIIEGLDLSDVAAGRYWLFCLPLKIQGGDGAPARAVLFDRMELDDL